MIQEEEDEKDDTPNQAPQRDRPHSQAPRRTSTGTDPINDQDLSLPPPKKYRGGFITRASAQQLLQCKSPSSCSTTSLAQLREKLTLLSPIHFTKVPIKIAVTPELPVLREENEDVLSDGFTKRCGVALKRPYHSDSETLTVKTKTRYLAPVIEEPSPSLALVAALGTSDQLVLNETFDRLYKSNSKFDLADLLVEEALKHGQDKDSGIISGKIYDSDIVEDTPVEEPARRSKLRLKRKPKDILENKSTTDDSDVVNDTPSCDYVWRKRGASVRENVNKKVEETLNAEAVEAFFSQKTNINNVGVVSPTTARILNRSSSDCSIIIEEIGEKEVSVNNLAIETDIVDCVNDIIDKVCKDIDVCVDLLVEQQQHIDILTGAQNIDHRLNDSCNKPKTPKEGSKFTKAMSTDNETVAGKTVTLKFKPNKQVRKNNPTREKKTKHVKKLNNTEGDSVLKDNTNKQSPAKELIRKKRKLYSPKDDENQNDEIPITKKVRRPSSSIESPMAACYIELENARKSRIRLPRKRASTRPPVSPKTKNLNDIFDSIKDNVVNDEKITVVPMKSEDLSLYNLSSESDDEAFQKKKIQVQKRISSSSLESRSKRKTSVKPVNYYSSYFSSEDEGERVLKPKKAKQTKPRGRKIKTPKLNLVDERMRNPQLELLETSFVKENIETNISKEPEPALNQPPVLETIPPDDLREQPIVSERKNKTPNKSDIVKIKTEKSLIKKCQKLSKSTGNKKKQEINKNVPTEGDSTAVSPLPGLVVETEPPKDDLTSSIESNLLQKFKKIYTDVNDLSFTQNLVLNANNNNNDGIETIVLSQNSLINLNDYNDNIVDPKEKLQTVDLLNGSEKSIETVGLSPITGHNNPDESPPNIVTLNESFQHRDVQIEGMSKSMTEFLDDMRTQLRNSKADARSTSPVIPITRLSTKNSTRSNVCAKKVSSDESINRPISTPQSVWSNESNPKVVLKRMSTEEIESHINSSTPKSKATTACRVVLTRMSSDEVKKVSTPTKSNTTASPVVVLDSLSTDEINRWLPMPGTIDVEDSSKHDSRRTTPKGITARRTSARSKGQTKPCVTCETTEPVISPVKLNFDVDPTGFGPRRSLRTRSCSSVRAPIRKNSSKSSAAKRSQENVLKIRSEKLKSVAQAVKGSEVVEISQDTAIISSAETVDVRSKEKIIGSTIAASGISKSVKSVKEWVQRNIAAEESSSDDNAARREMLYGELMEAIETRLVEIHESTSEAMTAAFLKDQEEIAKLLQEVARLEEQVVRLKPEILAHQKNKMDRACTIIRQDAQKKARMVQMLKEDIERLLK